MKEKSYTYSEAKFLEGIDFAKGKFILRTNDLTWYLFSAKNMIVGYNNDDLINARYEYHLDVPLDPSWKKDEIYRAVLNYAVAAGMIKPATTYSIVK